MDPEARPENYPTKNYSLYTLCALAQKVLDGKKFKDFVQLMLSGIYKRTQSVIDPILNRIPPDEGINLSRDYDSVLGIAENIMVEGAITVFPIAKREDTLTRDVHFEYPFTNSKGEFVAPVHKIPNLCIAKWDIHNMIRVVIPELYEEGRKPYLTQQEQQIFYEHGLQPAIVSLCALPATEWPPTYNDEMFHARRRNGQFSFGSKILGDWLVPRLGDAIRDALTANGHSSWATGMVFLHQIRGVKHATQHAANGPSSMEALRRFLDQAKLPWRLISINGIWFVDVGIEVSSHDYNCLAWRTDSHYHVVRKAIVGLNDTTVVRITRLGSSMYSRDIVSHLPAVSGCRIETATTRGDRNIIYLQLYTTDRAIAYRPDQGHYGKFIEAADLLNFAKAKPWIENLCSLYNSAIDTTPAHARIEVRVGLHHAADALLNLNERLYRGSLISVPRDVWWTFRSLRATAIKFVLQWQTEADPEYRARESALTLTACCAWLLNSLHSTPDLGQSWRAVVNASLPHVDRIGANRDILLFGTPDEEEVEESSDPEDENAVPRTRVRYAATTLPAAPYGWILTRFARLGSSYPVPRLNNDPRYPLLGDIVKNIFGCTLEELQDRFLRSRGIQSRHPHRVANKGRSL